MSSVTTLAPGYNRNHFLNTTTKVDTLGTSLVSATGEILVLPAGWSIIEVQMKKASTQPLGGTANNIILYLLEGNVPYDVMFADKILLNSVGHLVLSGAPANKSTYLDRFIMVRTDTGDIGNNDQSIKVIIKIARDNDEPVQQQQLIG